MTCRIREWYALEVNKKARRRLLRRGAVSATWERRILTRTHLAEFWNNPGRSPETQSTLQEYCQVPDAWGQTLTSRSAEMYNSELSLKAWLEVPKQLAYPQPSR